MMDVRHLQNATYAPSMIYSVAIILVRDLSKSHCTLILAPQVTAG